MLYYKCRGKQTAEVLSQTKQVFMVIWVGWQAVEHQAVHPAIARRIN